MTRGEGNATGKIGSLLKVEACWNTYVNTIMYKIKND